jgi:TonB family protein
MLVCSQGLVARCVTVLVAITYTQQTTPSPAVVLSQVEASYPAIAESARVSGTVNVRVGVRPDGSVSETTLLQDLPLLSAAAVKAASSAKFTCGKCTEPSTAHTIAFVFTLLDLYDNPRPPVWKQTGDGSSEVTVFGRVYECDHCPFGEPSRVRAARCLWLWRCNQKPEGSTSQRWQQFGLVGFNRHYVVSVPGAGLPDVIPITVYMNADGVPDPRVCEPVDK